MKPLADGLYLLRGSPPNAINVYLLGDVLIDAATRHAERRILHQIARREVTAHALTHAHPDHQGSSRAVCETLGIPYWVGEGDVEAVFIRAPIIRRTGPDVRVLAQYEGDPVLVEQGRHLVATFHPELTQDSRVHKLFLSKL